MAPMQLVVREGEVIWDGMLQTRAQISFEALSGGWLAR
jgi:hypothetical protein